MPGLHTYFTDVLRLNLKDISYLNDDLVFARLEDGDVFEMAFGDPVMNVESSVGRTNFTIVGGALHGKRASIKGKLSLRTKGVLRLSMIDVQQGDGLILDTPSGHLVTIDGGDNQLFARHFAARFAGTTKQKPIEIDAMVVTHGDADHFEGLSILEKSERDKRPAKRAFVHPARIYHNGLVKRPGKKAGGGARKDTEMFGAVKKVSGETFITDLVDDPRKVAIEERNRPFQTWTHTIDEWDKRRKSLALAPIEVSRIDQYAFDVFDFMTDDETKIEIFGPITEKIGSKAALRFLRKPDDDAELHLGGSGEAKGSPSASHTINGYSISFRLTFGNVRLIFTGDLNQEAMMRVSSELPNLDLKSEILKTPHHGSADFDYGFLKKVSPVVSIISSGDESRAKEYIHPRATLISALGRVSRGDTGIIFMTELAAFFAARGYSKEVRPTSNDKRDAFFAFERINFGIIHIRTDGERVIALTHSGKRGMNEAYGFTVSPAGTTKMIKKLTVKKG
jgi:beta-lactamase superfamily II metal-dependent hydrolase